MTIDNKPGITDSFEFARLQEKISKLKALELFDKGLLNQIEVGTFAGLSKIHRYLYTGIYDFAGTVRSVNISKGNFRFVPVIYLVDALDSISRMPQSTFDEIISKYIEMNVAHPFCDGNGRSMRIWLDLILKKELGMVINWGMIDKEDYLLAMERSPIKDVELKVLLKAALTNKTEDRAIYLKGIDQSYYFEGYNAFKSEYVGL